MDAPFRSSRSVSSIKDCHRGGIGVANRMRPFASGPSSRGYPKPDAKATSRVCLSVSGERSMWRANSTRCLAYSSPFVSFELHGNDSAALGLLDVVVKVFD